MKTNHFFLLSCLFCLVCTSCIFNNKQEEGSNQQDTTSYVKKYIPTKEEIQLLITEDQTKRNLWTYSVEESKQSPLFYEALNDDGLYLYRIISKEDKIYVSMIDDNHICELVDYISSSPTDSIGVEMKVVGKYEIINDSIVKIVFDDICNECLVSNGTEFFETIYHIRGTYTYQLRNLTWNRIKADTVVFVDERYRSLCGEKIWKYTK